MARYNTLLLDEAVACAMKLKSMSKASTLTGVHTESIRKHAYKKGLALWRKPQPSRYTPCQKLECIKMALKYIATGYIKNEIKAFKAAGKRTGVNGYSIWYQWFTKHIYGLGPAQHPGTASATSGSTIQAANPQDQRCIEQLRALVSNRPAPKIIKRRKYTSETLPDSMR